MSADLNPNNPDDAQANNQADSPAAPSGTGADDQAQQYDLQSVDDDEDQEPLGAPDPAPAPAVDKPEADDAPADEPADKPEEAPTAVATAAAKARADNLQRWNTSVAQENTKLKEKLAALEAPAPAAQPPAPKPAASEETFSDERFSEIEEKHGTAAALREHGAWQDRQTEERLLGKVESMLDTRKRNESREDAAVAILADHEISDEAYREMQMYGAMDEEMSFVSPPAWLLAQQLAGGPKNAVQIIKDAIAGTANPKPEDKERRPAKGADKNHPGADFGGGEPPAADDDSAASRGKFESQKASLMEAGF